MENDIQWCSSDFSVGELYFSDEDLKFHLKSVFTHHYCNRGEQRCAWHEDKKGIVINEKETYLKIYIGTIDGESSYYQISSTTDQSNGMTKAEAVEYCFNLIKKDWNEYKPKFKCVNTGSSTLFVLTIGDPYQGNKYLINAVVWNNNHKYVYQEENLSHEIVSKYRSLRLNDIAAAKNYLLDYLNGRPFRCITGAAKNEIIFNRNEFNFINM